MLKNGVTTDGMKKHNVNAVVKNFSNQYPNNIPMLDRTKSLPSLITSLPRQSSVAEKTLMSSKTSNLVLTTRSVRAANFSEDFHDTIKESVQSRFKNRKQRRCWWGDRMIISFGFCVITLILLIATTVFSFLVQLPGVAVFSLAFGLIFAYIIFLRWKYPIKIPIVIGSITLCFCLMIYCILVLVIWGVNSRLIEEKVKNESFKDSLLKQQEPIVFWGCPSGLYLPLKPDALSARCLLGHTLLGAFNFAIVISSLIIIISYSFILASFIKYRRNESLEELNTKTLAIFSIMPQFFRTSPIKDAPVISSSSSPLKHSSP